MHRDKRQKQKIWIVLGEICLCWYRQHFENIEKESVCLGGGIEWRKYIYWIIVRLIK